MAQNASIGDGRHVPFENVEVGAANGYRIDADDCIRVLFDGWLWHLVPRLLAGAVIDDRFHPFSFV
jgi:hypothetical protein